MSPSLSLTRQSLSTDKWASGVPMITQEDRLQPQMTANIATNNKLIKSESFFRLKPPETSRKCESCSPFRMRFPLRACFALLLYHWKTPKKPLNNTILFDLKKIHVKKIRACHLIISFGLIQRRYQCRFEFHSMTGESYVCFHCSCMDILF